ncbi:hypothetical protein EV44_g3500 [Erysiphe necator]|uniref:Uncharacterized protein n=1 Tax=Uncinula necator TaxID=52586 RepID=A0A0B1NX44_UNCNE|nr:hypothetical protein EV44_g3500 [Erysiphe necator]
MASIAARNAPKSGKLSEWTILAGNGPKKNINIKSGTTFPPPTKTSEESKRRVIFYRQEGTPARSSKTAQDKLHAVNMKLLSLKVPAHIRFVNLRHNERGNLTGLTTAQTTAEAMLPRVKEVCLQTALRFDGDITDISVNQQWINLKAYGVELARYHFKIMRL